MAKTVSSSSAGMGAGCFFGAGSGQLYWDSMTYAPTPTPMQAGMPDNLCSAHLSIGEAF